MGCSSRILQISQTRSGCSVPHWIGCHESHEYVRKRVKIIAVVEAPLNLVQVDGQMLRGKDEVASVDGFVLTQD